MVAKEIFRDLLKQGQVNPFYCEWEHSIMIVDNLKIISQNICKNAFSINSILEIYSHFNIILLQEPL